MGYVYTDIILKNTFDIGNYNRGVAKEPEIRQMTVRAMVDTGAGTLIITEAVRQALGLIVLGEQPATLADRAVKICKYTEPVEIHWGNRSTAVQAVVMEGADEVLMGAIPLEAMDLIVDPALQTLIGAHGDMQVMRV
jgi:clan AA aspartic protease